MSAPAATPTYTTSVINPFLPTAAAQSAQTASTHLSTSIHATRSFFDPSATGATAGNRSSSSNVKTFKQRPLSDDAGLIAGIVCAIFALFCLIIILSIFFWRWQERQMARMAPKEFDTGSDFETPYKDDKARDWGSGGSSPEWEIGHGGMVIELEEGKERESDLPAYTSPGAPGYQKSWEAGRSYS